MTTDPFPKEAAVRVDTAAGSFHVGGMAKGSGMIEPMLATMLAFVTTDAGVSPAAAADARWPRPCATRSTRSRSTASARPTTASSRWPTARAAWWSARRSRRRSRRGCVRSARELALGIVRGGEGATKLVTVRVTGRRQRDHAERAAREAIANSPAREDRHARRRSELGPADRGRRAAPACRSTWRMPPSRSGERCSSRRASRSTRRRPSPPSTCRQRISGSRSTSGRAAPNEATMWTCDLSAEYVKINADYRT